MCVRVRVRVCVCVCVGCDSRGSGGWCRSVEGGCDQRDSWCDGRLTGQTRGLLSSPLTPSTAPQIHLPRGSWWEKEREGVVLTCYPINCDKTNSRVMISGKHVQIKYSREPARLCTIQLAGISNSY